MNTSIHMLGIELPRKNFRVLMQVEGIVISQSACIGLHVNMDTRINARPQATTNALVTLTTIANLWNAQPAKIDRQRRRIEVFTATSVRR